MSKTVEERIQMGIEMVDFALETMKKAILLKNPGINETELKIAAFTQFYRKDFTPAEIEKIAGHFRAFDSRPK